MQKEKMSVESIIKKVEETKLPENYKETEQYKNWIRFELSTKNYYPHDENQFLFKRIICKSYIKQSNIENAGYGVFASEKINAGDLIEEAPFVVLETTHKANRDIKLTYYSYSYAYPYENNLQNKNCNMMIPFGNFLCYNHSIKPNAYYIQDDNFKILRMFAYKDIEKDEEITWYYSPGYSNKLLEEKFEFEKKQDKYNFHHDEN
jgi:hypothetical protein